MIIEAIIIEYLEKTLGIETYAEIPEVKPDKYIIVEKIDGGRINQIDASTLSVYSYAKTLVDAAVLNEQVKSALLNAIVIDDITSSKIGGENRNIDKDNKEYRYETIINLYHY